MRRLWRKFTSSRRRLQLLILCFTILTLNLLTSLVFKPNHTSPHSLNDIKNNIVNTLKLEDTETKTVSYNEILPDINEINENHDEINEIITEATSENINDEIRTFPPIENPWFSGHDHDSGSDPLDLKPEDFEYAEIDQCKIRTFNNVTVFSRAEFIHEYIDFRNE